MRANWYVWSDTDQQYLGTRIIFTDTEKSNWTWDPEAGAYYWHRFFSHQPDLNFDNPRVLWAMLQVMRRWLDLGVDGFRLDAIPYLCEREGTNNENLAETHAIIKKIRAELDAYGARPAAAGRGQPVARGRQRLFRRRRRVPHGVPLPADAAHLHGDRPGGPLPDRRHPAADAGHPGELPVGDVPAQSRRADARDGDRRRARLSVVDLRDRPARAHQSRHPPPPRAADGQRSAQDRADERRCCCRCPGTPIIYYGDEIGMGDNIYLGDRNGVRTPMQWTPDRNGGFSRADPAKLFLPPIMDPVYGYQAVNVEAQSRSLSSLLSWMKRMIAVRKTSRVFGRGSMTFIRPANRAVLVYRAPVRGRGSAVRRQPVALRAGGRDRSFALARPRAARDARAHALSPHRRGALRHHARALRVLLVPAARRGRESAGEIQSVPPEFVTLVMRQRAGHRLFEGRTRTQSRARRAADLPGRATLVRREGEPAARRDAAGRDRRSKAATPAAGSRFSTSRADADRRATPFRSPSSGPGSTRSPQARRASSRPSAAYAARGNAGRRQHRPGIHRPAVAQDRMRAKRSKRTAAASNSARPGRSPKMPAPTFEGVKPVEREQSNTTTIVDNKFVVKVLRRLQPGVHPEIEMGRFLTDVVHYPQAPPLARHDGAARRTTRARRSRWCTASSRTRATPGR